MTRHHHTSGGVVLIAVIVLAVLYVGWRSGLLGRLWAGVRSSSLRGELREHRISPFTLLPLALLVIVVVVLLIAD